jgi:hypothetical protein
MSENSTNEDDFFQKKFETYQKKKPLTQKNLNQEKIIDAFRQSLGGVKKEEMSKQAEKILNDLNNIKDEKIKNQKIKELLGLDSKQSTPTNPGKKTEICTICPNKTAQQCSVCKVAYYCSRECQLQDWKVHKLICKK